MNKSITLLFGLIFSATTSIIAENSPYISKVYEYSPAPGQFINEMPEYEEGDNNESMLAKVEEQICGDRNPGMISLGAFGGYVVFGFDHPIVNVENAYDFKIYGNAFLANGSSSGGSCEPGIVMVSVDENGDGLPNDKWFELAGSEYNKETTKKNYQITYYQPAADKVAEPDPDYKIITDTTYIKYTTNDSEQPEGYVKKNSFHSQSYWPEWIDAETLEFNGTKLADNYSDESGNGTYYVLNYLDWGYADNMPNDQYEGFNIDWAVDENGNPVKLNKIDFVKVYTAVNQYCGWIGETSTEISGAEDLHPEAEISEVESIVINSDEIVMLARNSDFLALRNGDKTKEAYIFAMNGQLIKIITLSQGDNIVDISSLQSAIYLLRCENKIIKFRK